MPAENEIPDEPILGDAPLLNGDTPMKVHRIPTLTFTESNTRMRLMKDEMKKSRSEQLKRTFSDGQERYSASVLAHRRTRSDQPSYGVDDDMGKGPTT